MNVMRLGRELVIVSRLVGRTEGVFWGCAWR
jgi:hypothetical protein